MPVASQGQSDAGCEGGEGRRAVCSMLVQSCHPFAVSAGAARQATGFPSSVPRWHSRTAPGMRGWVVKKSSQAPYSFCRRWWQKYSPSDSEWRSVRLLISKHSGGAEDGGVQNTGLGGEGGGPICAGGGNAGSTLSISLQLYHLLSVSAGTALHVMMPTLFGVSVHNRTAPGMLIVVVKKLSHSFSGMW